MRITPLTGYVLVELDAPEKLTLTGLHIPERTMSAEEHQQADKMPSKPRGITGKVVEIGPWPRLKNGLAVMPEFGMGARVLVRPGSGTTMNWEISGRLKMLRTEDVLAVLP
jgi:co-chaperonin GroES (HSP10)